MESKLLEEGNGPWNPGNLEIENQHGNFSVKKATEYLHSKVNVSASQTDHIGWIKEKWTINRKKDVVWRLKLRALPLEY